MTIVQSDRVRASFANKIKKWLDTVDRLRNSELVLALPITRLTSIKSLCQERKAARSFALYIARRVLQQMQEAIALENLGSEEWQDRQILASAIVGAIAKEETLEVLQQYLEKIDEYQSRKRRKAHWTMAHFAQSRYWRQLEYALRCYTDSDREIWGYKLAREYVERYSPAYGTGLIPDSIPFLLDIAEFWCRYYFDLSLHEKFSKAIARIEGISLHECLTSYQSPVLSVTSHQRCTEPVEVSPVTSYQSSVTSHQLPVEKQGLRDLLDGFGKDGKEAIDLFFADR